MITTGIVLEIVIATLAADQLSRMLGFAQCFAGQVACPVHPGQHDIRLEAVYLRRERRNGPAIKEPAKRQFNDIDACLREPRATRIIRAGRHRLGNPALLERDGKTDKELFGSADRATGHRLHQPHAGRKRSNAAAASSQLQFRCCARAASCWSCQRALSLSRAIARSAKAASSAAT